MKRVISLLLAALFVLTALPAAFAAENTMTFDKTAADFVIRDPFVLVHDGLYYMYGTCATPKPGYGCFVSPDLAHWAGPFNVFTAAADFDGDKNFWAPECHAYGGAFYLFATYHSRTTDHRGVSVFRADDPLGPFEEISDGHVTPHDQDCIDGTLYVDGAGQPYMVYVAEWTSTDDGIGRMAAAPLSDDLTHFISEPRELFRADDPFWKPHKITDGPFLYKSRTGKLLMLWSNMSPDGYCVALASAKSITGKWRQQLARLYVKDRRRVYDGGHGMLFTDLNGQLTLCIHAPNDGDVAPARAAFFPVRDLGYTLALSEKPSLQTRLLRFIDFLAELLR